MAELSTMLEMIAKEQTLIEVPDKDSADDNLESRSQGYQPITQIKEVPVGTSLGAAVPTNMSYNV